jgi:hypothetical protein
MKFHVLVLTLSSLTAGAQVEVGLKAGVSLSGERAKSDDVAPIYLNSVDSKALAGLNGGIYVEIRRKENLSLQPELNFRNAGFHLPKNNFADQKLRMSYVDVSLLFKYYLTTYKNVRVYSMAGPYGGVRVDANLISQYDDEKEYESMDGQLEETRQSGEAGLILAAGGITQTSFGKFGVELRYMHSITNIYKPAYNINAKGSSFSFGIQLSYIYDLNQILGPRKK